MPKRKKDFSKVGLGSPEVEGQGTTELTNEKVSMDSSRKKKKKDFKN